MNKLALFFIFVSSIELLGREVQQSTFSYWNKPDINIFYSLPTSINENTKIYLSCTAFQDQQRDI